jgi:hypothetical protein
MTYTQVRLLIATLTLILAAILLCDSYIIKPRVTTEIFSSDSVYNSGFYRSVDRWYLVSTSGEVIWTGKPVMMNPGDAFLLNRSRLLRRQLSVDYHDFEFSHGRMVHYPLGTFRGTPTMRPKPAAYSDLKLSAGLAIAALKACSPTVTNAMTMVISPASAKIHQPMDTL